jgi:4-aminobutyrate aminotransferase-like enzyme
MGACLYERLLALKARVPLMGDVRDRGIMLAIQFVRTVDSTNPESLKAVVHENLVRGLLTVGCGLYANVLRIIPPLILTREQRQMGPKFARKYSTSGGGAVECSF